MLLTDIKYDKRLYPRISVIPELVQKYTQDIDYLPPIEIDQHNRIIDGVHRWMAHCKNDRTDIDVIVTRVTNDNEFLELAILRNASHGQQLSQDDKKKMAIQLYRNKAPHERKDYKKELERIFSTHKATINRWVSDIDTAEKENRDNEIRELWMACYDEQTIADEMGLDQSTIHKKLNNFMNLAHLRQIHKLAATYEEPDFEVPLYNIWNDAKLTNKVGHFGNTEQAFLDRLLYLYTDPFDIVIDPFAGGGSTIDVCRHRSRRYLVSDRKPIMERGEDIRQHDVTDGILKPPQWKDVSLVYLDPPYWRQAQGEYSNDETDLGNMELDTFNETLSSVIMEYASCLERSQRQKLSYIALIIRPTQWNADNREFTNHITDMILQTGLPVDMQISVPYSTEQYTPQCVNWAKENRKILVLTREIVVWRIGDDQATEQS